MGTRCDVLSALLFNKEEGRNQYREEVMASDPGNLGAVLTTEVIAAIEHKWKRLGSPILTPAAVGWHACISVLRRRS